MQEIYSPPPHAPALGWFTKLTLDRFCQITFCLVPIGVVFTGTKNIQFCSFRAATLFHKVEIVNVRPVVIVIISTHRSIAQHIYT